MSNELTTTGGSISSMDEMDRMAKAIADSKLFGIQTASQALVLMAICRSEGKDPVQAVKTYHIISVNGVSRPSMRADAMLAEFQAQGGTVEWGERSHTEVSATFYHPSGGAVPVRWAIEDAERAQLTGNQMWRKYPRQMLTARVISEGIRTCLPGVVSGIYTPEEVSQFDDKPARPGAYGSSPLIEGTPVNLPEPAQITSAPNPPSPDPDKLAAIREFVEAADEAGYRFSATEARKERDELVRHLLAFEPDVPLTAAAFRNGTEALRRLVSRQEVAEESEPPAEGVPARPEEVAVANSIQEDALDLSDLSDPFAESVAPARAPSYAEQETAARGKGKAK